MEMKQKLDFKGKIYILQHPGNRAWLELKSTLLDARTGRISSLKLLDYSFEHVVFPVDGPPLKVDTIPVEEVEDWQVILSNFFRGELDEDYKWESFTGDIASAGSSGSGKPGAAAQKDK